MAPTLQQEIIHPPLMATKRNLHIIPGLRIFVCAVICPCVLAPSAGGLLYLSHKARRLFTVGTFGDSLGGFAVTFGRVLDLVLNPNRQLFAAEQQTPPHFPIRNSFVIGQIIQITGRSRVSQPLQEINCSFER